MISLTIAVHNAYVYADEMCSYIVKRKKVSVV